ncbi:MAG TPA: galactose oxidase-like domain-containing protein [Acidimicrobiales bacterium]
MADRLVTHVARDSRGLTLALANPAEDWFQRRAEWAIADIVSGRHRYFVEGNSRPIAVVDGPSGLYLRSDPDASTANNLDTLPSHDRSPWEIAHDDAEVLAVHAALTGHGAAGQVLLLGGNEHDEANADDGTTDNTRIYDVATNAVLAVDSPEADAFCCGHAFLPDGRLLVGGGSNSWGGGHHEVEFHRDGTRACAAYRAGGIWDPVAPLQPEPGGPPDTGGRWYPSLVTLADGRVLAVAGHPRLTDSRHGAWHPEVYDPVADAWSYTPGHWLYVTWSLAGAPPEGQEPHDADSYSYYPRLFTVPGGRVFLASPNDERCGFYDLASGMVETLVDSPPHGGRFDETNHTAVLLPLLPGDGYTPRVLFVGLEGPHRITLETGEEAEPPTWEPTAPRDWPADPPLRRHGCAVLLPTGEVFLAGGIDNAGDPGLPDTDAVLEGELYRPGIDWASGAYEPDAASESWTTTAPATVARNYHSVALLLPNGLVLTAGSNLDGQAGGDDVKEYRIEVYSPPYDGDPLRPDILQAPAELAYGQTFAVATTRADHIQRVALTRCGSVTHAWDGDQRYVGLEFTVSGPGALEATAPPDGGVAPPGPYLLWVVDGDDRPCVRAPFVLLG